MTEEKETEFNMPELTKEIAKVLESCKHDYADLLYTCITLTSGMFIVTGYSSHYERLKYVRDFTNTIQEMVNDAHQHGRTAPDLTEEEIANANQVS